jgi:hypothetical protein
MAVGVRSAAEHTRRQAGNTLPESGAHSETRGRAEERENGVYWVPRNLYMGRTKTWSRDGWGLGLVPRVGVSSRRIPRQTVRAGFQPS